LDNQNSYRVVTKSELREKNVLGESLGYEIVDKEDYGASGEKKLTLRAPRALGDKEWTEGYSGSVGDEIIDCGVLWKF